MEEDNIQIIQLQPAALDNLPTELLIKIFQKLSFFDLQNARLVCKHWHNISHSSSTLFDNSMLRLTKQNRNDVFKLMQEIPTIMQDLVKNLCLENLSYNEKCAAFFIEFGYHIQRLWFNRSNPTFLYSMQLELANVRELQLSNIAHASGEMIRMGTFDLTNFPNLKALLIRDNVPQKLKSSLLHQLISLGSKLQITHLSVNITSEDHELILKAIETYTGTLKKLELICVSRTTLQFDQWTLQLQMLKKLQVLHLTCNFKHIFLMDIFQSLPADAPLRHIDLSGTIEIYDAVIECILQKWAKTLEELTLMFCSGTTDRSIAKLDTVRGKLRVLSLFRCHGISSLGLINGIASKQNHQLRELNIGALENLNEDCICVIAENLPNLEYLNIFSCGDAVTDRALSCIFRYQTKLKTLNLGYCSKITDDGLLGVNLNGGYAIHRLRGLTLLNLCGCQKITNLTLINGLKFVELRTLELSYCCNITDIGISALVKNCPTLEKLDISSCRLLNDEAIGHIAKKLKRLRNLNASNCIHLTERSIDNIIESSESIVELSLWGIDSLKKWKVEKRLQRLKPQLKGLHM